MTDRQPGRGTSTRLAELAAATPGSRRRGDAAIVDATHDSRQVQPGWLFCCVRGANADGHDHAPQAVERGAAALLVERFLDLDVPQLEVDEVRAAIGPVAAVVHHHPSARLDVVGVTGTNGKTTTTHLLESVFGANGWGTGLVGTVQTRIHGSPQPGVRTTPEGTDLQRLLADMHARGVDAVAMEVSSHGLDLRRVDGTRFAVAVFTNLTQDHLDHHGTMEAYYAAKRRLFTPELSTRAVIGVEDDWGRRLAGETDLPVTTYGATDDAHHRITRVEAELDGTRFELTGPHEQVELWTPLVGAYNARNAAAAYLASRALGVDADVAARGVAACRGVPGRLEPVVRGQPFAVLVDYAHTPDALEQVLVAARDLADGRTLVVVGCGGDRDRGKRPLMGAAAAAADVAVLTSDNPRTEDPAAILAEVAAGAEDARSRGATAEVVVEVDRRAAIAQALERARAGDVVVIAGKGHETGQELADRTVPFDDRAVAAELLEQRASRPSVRGAGRPVTGGAA